MAARKPSKPTATRRPAASSPAAAKAARAVSAKPAKSALERLEATVADLSGERDRLRAEIAAARKQIADLEAARVDAINRIDWAIDSLRSVLQK